jgi:hypothetical protein
MSPFIASQVCSNVAIFFLRCNIHNYHTCVNSNKPPAEAIAHKRSGGAGIGHLCGTASRVTRIIAAHASIFQPRGHAGGRPSQGRKEVRKRPEHRVGGLLQVRTLRRTGLRTQEDQIRHLARGRGTP